MDDHTAGEDSADDIETSPPEPVKRYRLLSGEVDSATIPIDGELWSTLTIDGDRWSGTIDCAQFGVTTSIGGEGQLEIGEIELATANCDQNELGEAGDLVVAALARVVVLTSSNELVRLSGPDVDLLFEWIDTSPPLPTEGLAGSFILRSGTLDTDPIPLLAGAEPSLVIDGRNWHGNAPCNGYGGVVEVEDDRLTVGEITQNMAGCFPDEIMTSEQRYLDAFRRVDRYELTGDELVLSGDGVELTFERGERPPVPTPLPSGYDDIPSGNFGAAVTDDRVLLGIEDDESFGVADLSTSLPESTMIVDLDVVSQGVVVLGTRLPDDAGSTNCTAEVLRVDGDNQPVVIASNAITPSVNRDGGQPQVAFGVIERIDDICYVTGVATVDLGSGTRFDFDIDDVPDSGFPDWNLTWSADGLSLVATSGTRVDVIGLDGSSSSLETELLMAVPNPTGDSVVGMSGCCIGQAFLARQDLDTGSVTELAPLAGHIQSIRPEGDRIVIVTTDGSASVYTDSAGLQPLTTTPYPVVDVRLASPRP